MAYVAGWCFVGLFVCFFFYLHELFLRGLFVNSGISRMPSFLLVWGLGHLCLCNQVQVALFNRSVIEFLYH